MSGPVLLNEDFYVEYSEDDKWKRSTPKTHFHLSYEIYYLIENDVSYFIKDRLYRVVPGTVMIIPPNTIHTTKSLNVNPRKRYLINLPEGYIRPFLDIRPDLLTQLGTTPLVFTGIKRIELTDLFKKLLNEYSASNPDKIMINSLLGELLVTLGRYAKTQKAEKKDSGTQAKIIAISNYINENLEKDITLSKLSDLFFINPAYLSRAFKKKLNISFSDYLRTVRIKQACKLLSETDMSITDIAYKTGFQSCSDFCRVFRYAVKISPLKYRKKEK